MTQLKFQLVGLLSFWEIYYDLEVLGSGQKKKKEKLLNTLKL